MRLTEHLTHVLMFAMPLLAFAGLFVLEWRRTEVEPIPSSLRIMAVAVLGSALVHGAAVHHHSQEAAVLGWFFALLSLAQFGWVLALLVAPVRRIVVAGVWCNLAVIALWAWTRLVGLPLGIEGGQREGIGTADLVATVLEATCVVAGLAWVRVRAHAPKQLPTLAARQPRYFARIDATWGVKVRKCLCCSEGRSSAFSRLPGAGAANGQ